MTTLTRRALLAAGAATALAAPAIAQRAPEVVLWVQAGPEADALTRTAQAYAQATGNPATVAVQGRAGWRQKYETALAAGTREFDAVLHITRFVPSLAAGGLLAPLPDGLLRDPGWNAEDFPEVIRKEMSYDGRWFMAPTDVTLETLVYRRDLIGAPPPSWEALRETAIRFTRERNPGSPTRYGYAYAAGAGTVMGSFLGIMASYGGGIADDNGCALTDRPGTIEAWRLFVGLKNADRVTPPDITAWDYPELLVGLQNGTLAMASFFTAGMPILTDCAQSPQVCNGIALSVQPAGPAGSRTRVNPLGLMVNSASARKDATFAFIRWATGPEGARIYTQAGGASPRASLLADAALNAQRPWTPEVLKAVNAGVGTIRHAQAREIGEAFDRFAQQAIAGTITPEESLRRATAEIRSQVRGARCA